MESTSWDFSRLVFFLFWIWNKVFVKGEDDIYDEEEDKYYSGSQVAQFGYSLLVFAVYFVTECIPVPVTSMLPYIFFPLFGLSSGWFLIFKFFRFFQLTILAGTIASKYWNNTNYLLFGGLLVALGIETTNLHRRVALNILKVIGTSVRKLMLGFMLVTWLLSMERLWIFNRHIKVAISDSPIGWYSNLSSFQIRLQLQWCCR